MQESACTGFSRNLPQRDSLWPPRVPVHYGQKVSESVRWREESYQVYVNVRESVRRKVKSSEVALDMPMYFRLLKVDTCSSPVTNLFRETPPDESLAYQLNGGVGPRMRDPVYESCLCCLADIGVPFFDMLNGACDP